MLSYIACLIAYRTNSATKQERFHFFYFYRHNSPFIDVAFVRHFTATLKLKSLSYILNSNSLVYLIHFIS